jgi:hypothetical protein
VASRHSPVLEPDVFPFLRSRALLLGCFFLWMLGGCTPEELVGPPSRPDGDDFKGGDVDDEEDGGALGPSRFSFAISASASSPNEHQGSPATGPYDLYLWLVCANNGLAQLQADFDVEGDALVEDHFFSPAEGVVSIVWQEFGEVNLAVAGCPKQAALLGRLHLVGEGEGVRIGMRRPSEDMGALACANGSEVRGFSCIGYASDGNPPPQQGPQDACASNPYAGQVRFTLSASDTDPYQQTAPAADGPMVLWLWSVSGEFSALQADIGVESGVPFDPVFSAEPPFLSLNMSGGPDVLLAAPGCSWGTNLLGSLIVVDDGSGVTVTMTPGPGGGAVDCDVPDPHVHSFSCLAFSSGS